MKRNIIIMILLLLVFVISLLYILPTHYDSKVLTVQDIEKQIYTNLQQQGAAKLIEGEKNKLKITNIEQAKSQNSMPPVLNNLGQKGWKLTSINDNQLYIFQRSKSVILPIKWEYKVLSIKDIERQAIPYLVKIKAAESIKGEENKFKILDKSKAQYQHIMPVVFNDLGQDGWTLTAVNKAKLYIFSRSIKIL